MPHRHAAASPTYRTFHPDDSEQVHTLVLSILESELRDLPKEHHLREIEVIGDVYGGAREEFWIAEHEGRIIGVLGLKEDDRDSALIQRFFVNPHWRGKSVGKTLLQKAIAFAKDQGYKRLVFLGHEHMKEAKAMLGKVGFQEEMHLVVPGAEFFRLSLKI